MDDRTKLIDWAARNHETKWAALQWLYDEVQAAERERCAKICELESVTLVTRDQTRGALYCAQKIRA